MASATASSFDETSAAAGWYSRFIAHHRETIQALRQHRLGKGRSRDIRLLLRFIRVPKYLASSGSHTRRTCHSYSGPSAEYLKSLQGHPKPTIILLIASEVPVGVPRRARRE